MLDLRGDPAPVLLADITSSGWDSAVRQADDVRQLISRIEAGTFGFHWEDQVASLRRTSGVRSGHGAAPW
ncbi:hypothetical protein [Micromonospora sp. CA-246542]|uniref:hypothetical protein n=1 Tax=Micromonospora sp. CA-246542 TaxID=3239959 RepID=UPI003D908881